MRLGFSNTFLRSCILFGHLCALSFPRSQIFAETGPALHEKTSNVASAVPEKCTLNPLALENSSVRKHSTPLWSFEYSGLDLSREYVDKKTAVAQVPVTILDEGNQTNMIGGLPPDRANADLVGGFGGSDWWRFIIGEKPLGASAKARVIGYFNPHRSQGSSAPSPVRIWVDIYLDTDDDNYNRLLAKVPNGPRGALVVIAGTSGSVNPENKKLLGSNEVLFPYPIETTGMPGVGSELILGKEAHSIAVPTSGMDAYLPEASQSGGPYVGQNVGAQLIVAAAADAQSLLPSLSAKDLKQLILLTGSRTIPQFHPTPIPLLNAYRLVRVVDRLRELCPESSGDSQICIRSYLDDPEKRSHLIDFNDSALALLNSAKEILNKPNPSCPELLSAFKQLRQSTLLAPDMAAPRESLSKLYARFSKTENAFFYRNGTDIGVWAVDAHSWSALSSRSKKEVLKWLLDRKNSYPEEYASLIRNGLYSTDPEVQKASVERLGAVPIQDWNPIVREVIERKQWKPLVALALAIERVELGDPSFLSAKRIWPLLSQLETLVSSIGPADADTEKGNAGESAVRSLIALAKAFPHPAVQKRVLEFLKGQAISGTTHDLRIAATDGLIILKRTEPYYRNHLLFDVLRLSKDPSVLNRIITGPGWREESKRTIRAIIRERKARQEPELKDWINLDDVEPK